MKISIIIPTFRKEKLLDFQLPSFARQTFPKEDFEVIIVDDYPDSRQRQVEEFAKANGMNIKWIRSKKPYYRSNANIGCARNTGLIHAEGELVVFNDDFSYVKPEYLEKVWMVYRTDSSSSHIGPVISLEYTENPPEDITSLKVRHGDERTIARLSGINLKIGFPVQCRNDWFVTSNASAPLRDIMKVNGFWELADLTREEDVLMGRALDGVGRGFCFVNDPDITVYHMCHDGYKSPEVGKFKDVTYEELGWKDVNIKGRIIQGLGGSGRCGLDTDSDQVQRVTRDVFNTESPGSWALIEHFDKNRDLKFNEEIGFDLIEERRKAGYWV